VILGFNGLSYTGHYPPDVTVAAGPNHVVELVNVIGGIWTKEGSFVRSLNLSSIFNTGRDSLSDPKILYDALSGRWFASIADEITNSVVVAVSATNDPTAGWTSYRINQESGYFPDQPKLGISSSVVVVSANVYTCATCNNLNLVGGEYWVINKSEMLAGGSVHWRYVGPEATEFGEYAAQSLSSTTKGFLVSVTGCTGSPRACSVLHLITVVGVPPDEVSVTKTSITINPA